MKKMRITPMNKNHINGVYEIEKDCFAIPWSKRAFEQELDNKLAIYVVAEEEGQILGYGGMWHIVTEGHITNIAVHRSHRRKGIGDAIIKSLLEIGKQKEMIGLTLEVRKSNEAAQALYRNNGFIIEGIRPEYYEDNKEDALIMWRYLIDKADIVV